jgi:dodecin
MTVARTTDGFEAAVRSGLERASSTVRNIQAAWIKDQEVEVRDGAISAFKVTMKVTFVVDD